MVQLALTFVPTLLAALVAATPLQRRAWPSGDVTCGSNIYTLDEVKAAVDAGYAQVDDPIGDSVFSIPRKTFEIPTFIRQLPAHVQ